MPNYVNIAWEKHRQSVGRYYGFTYIYKAMGCKRLLFFEKPILQVVHREKKAKNSKKRIDYYPGGMPLPNRNVQGNYRYGYQGQELDPETGKPAFELRLYDPRINRWLTTDPAGQYSSPYLAMGNNWINLVDEDGGYAAPPSTGVTDNGDGTYTVVNAIDDNDTGVYLVDENGNYDINTSTKIANSVTSLSFFNSDTNSAQVGAIIDFNDVSGSEFIANFIDNTPSLDDYIANATGGRPLDFKRTNGTNSIIYNNTTDYYRGGLFGVQTDGTPIVASARDIGNIAAGYISAHNGLPWRLARIGFDVLETKQRTGYSNFRLSLHFLTYNRAIIEGKGTQAAQFFGFNLHERN